MAPPAFLSAVALPLRGHATARATACARRVRAAPRACEAAPPAVDLDQMFARLTHVNKNLRKKAAISISEQAGDAEVARLLELLELDDTTHRRAAVDALGMIGVRALPALTDLLATSDSSTARASCAKAMAAFCMYYPAQRADFPPAALDGLRNALAVDADPVTRLSVVGCLGVLGSDAVDKDAVPDGAEGGAAAAADGADGAGVRHPGCTEALDILTSVCENVADMGIAANAVAAVAQIGQNAAPERKQRVIDVLRRLCSLEDSDPESGVEYVRQMAAGNLAQLEGGPSAPVQA